MNLQMLNDLVAYQQFICSIPRGRWDELEEMAGAAGFLAPDASSFMTGSPVFGLGTRSCRRHTPRVSNIFLFSRVRRKSLPLSDIQTVSVEHRDFERPADFF